LRGLDGEIRVELSPKPATLPSYPPLVKPRLDTPKPARHAAIDALPKNRALTDALMQFAREGIVVLDRYGEVEALNSNAERLLGVAREAAVGRQVGEVFQAVDPDTGEPVDLASERFRNPQLAPSPACLVGPDGRRGAIAFTLRPIASQDRPELSGALLYLEDRAASEFAEKQIRLIATALKSIGEGVIVTDDAWSEGAASILYANDGFSEITGYADYEVVGQSVDILNGPNTDPGIVEEMAADLRQGQPAAGESVNYRKDGSEFIAAWKIFPVYIEDDAEEPTHYVAILRDVSQIRRLEQDLFQSQKMEAVGRLAGGIAHDFNNILAVILSFSELIMEKSDPEDPNLAYLAEIRKAAERAADLTQQLLSFSRRNKNLKPEILDAAKVARDMHKILGRLIPENISFDLAVAPDQPLYIYVNRTALEQILINFTTNARDAMPGGGSIEVALQRCEAESAERLLPDYMEAKPYLALSFQDDGQGIDPETQRRIFEPFFTTKETGKGTGLGLATVYGIVKQANGHIEVASEPGRGTLFRIFLPLVADDQDKEETRKDDPPAESLVSDRRESVLVVEDDETMCDCLSGLLGLYNYEVFSTNKAEDALQLMEEAQTEINLLVTDLILPKMRGSELAERLTRRFPDMQVIYMTGYSEEILAQFNLPPDAALLKKPFSLKAALATVQEMLADARR